MNLRDEDIQIYLLDASALPQATRAAIEAAMESDSAFAERVADAVLGLQRVEQAAARCGSFTLQSGSVNIANPEVALPTQVGRTSWMMPLAVSLSFATVVALGWFVQSSLWDASESQMVAGADVEIEQMVADSWIAVLGESTEDDVELIGFVTPDNGEAESDDWMLDAILLAYDEGEA